jgi:hypothetical protein
MESIQTNEQYKIRCQKPLRETREIFRELPAENPRIKKDLDRLLNKSFLLREGASAGQLGARGGNCPPMCGNQRIAQKNRLIF